MNGELQLSNLHPSAPTFDPQHTLVSYPYLSVITFGGCRDDFMVVTTQRREPGGGKKIAEKLIFAMPKPKVGPPPPPSAFKPENVDYFSSASPSQQVGFIFSKLLWKTAGKMQV